MNSEFKKAKKIMSYLHVSKLKKRNRNRKKLFNIWNLKGSTFRLNAEKRISDIQYIQ